MRPAAAAEQDDPEAFPRPFGQYLLLENFARGGMGEVYLAKLGGIAGLERYCVLKKLRSELTRDREYVTRFIDEARVVVTLNHANICHVFDVGRVGEEYYLAMEYISGRDVRTIQDRCRTKEKTMHPASALHMVCETLEALDYAHRRNHPLTGEPLNLVHRDVSPQNVLVSYEGEVKLIDFGLAASKLKVERTQPNVVMGKMAYMAPEQARGDPIDARADLFACGVLAYELLSGERFYEGMTANDIWQVAGKGGFIPRKWDQIDRELSKHLSKALHPDPRKRFASCGDFREALASHMHWRFPGTGVRGLRELMSDAFAEELRREAEMLARFGKVTVAGFRTEFEGTKSQSISLARADETSPAQKTTLVRNEQSSSAASAGVMPPPSGARDKSSAPKGERDVHQDPTRLVSSKEHTAQAKAQKDTTDEKPGEHEDSATVIRPEPRPSSSDQPHESTMRVTRARPSVATVDDRTSLAVDPPVEVPKARVGIRLAAAAVAVAVVVVGAYVALRPDEGSATSPRPTTVASTPAPPTAPSALATSTTPASTTPASTTPTSTTPTSTTPTSTPTSTTPTSTTPTSTTPTSTTPTSTTPTSTTPSSTTSATPTSTGPSSTAPPIEPLAEPVKGPKGKTKRERDREAARDKETKNPAPPVVETAPKPDLPPVKTDAKPKELSDSAAATLAVKCGPCKSLAIAYGTSKGQDDSIMPKLRRCLADNACR